MKTKVKSAFEVYRREVYKTKKELIAFLDEYREALCKFYQLEMRIEDKKSFSEVLILMKNCDDIKQKIINSIKKL